MGNESPVLFNERYFMQLFLSNISDGFMKIDGVI